MTSTTHQLRPESLDVVLLVLTGYGVSDGSWLLFIVLFLVPDLRCTWVGHGREPTYA